LRGLHSFPTRRSSDLVPGNDLVLEDVGLVLARIDAQLDAAGRPPLARFRRDHDGLAGREHRVEAGRADADALLPAGLLEPVEFRDRKSTRLNSSHVKI